jgi:predicted transcriptional regulator
MSVEKNISHEAFGSSYATDEPVISNLYTSVGNHEGKAILLGNMEEGTGYTLSKLHDLVVAPQGTDPVSVGAKTNPYRWVRHSLHPHGMVEEEHVVDRTYYLSEVGRREGQPFAGWQLDLSLNSPEAISLRGLFGMTKTRSGKTTTPPVDRLNIYKQIAESGQLSLNELDDKINIPRGTIINNLNWMDENGVIEYNSIDFKTVDETIDYEIVNDFTLYANGGSMREAVFGTILEMQKDSKKSFSKLEFIEAAKMLYPDKELDQAKSRKSALRILRELVEENHLTKKVNEKVNEHEISLNPAMRTVVGRLLEIADGMAQDDKDFRDEGNNKLRNILSSEEQVRHLVQKAVNASPEANSKSLMVRTREIESCLASAGAATISEVTYQLSDKGITKSAIRETLAHLKATGKAISHSKHGEHLWTLLR